MRLIFLIVCYLFTFSCDSNSLSFKKIPVDKIVSEEIGLIDFTSVDEYPLYEVCLNKIENDDKNNCFLEVTTNYITETIKKANLDISINKNDTIFIDFNFKKSGEAKIKNISNSNNDDYLQSIFDLFEKDSTGLPKFYPAVKRGQEVDVVFEFPLILYTN